MKRIFVCEFITCGGLRDSELTSPLFADAELMYQALLADIREIEYLEIITTRDDRLIPVSESIANIENSDDPWEIWKNCMETADLAWIIAPESDAILLKLNKMARACACEVIGCDDDAVTLTTSKYATNQHLNDIGIPALESKRLSDETINSDKGWIVKRDDGAGGDDCHFFQNIEEYSLWEKQVDNKNEYIQQSYVEGIAASMSVLYGIKKTVLLSCNKQLVRIESDKLFVEKIILNDLHAQKRQLQVLANKIGNAIPGLRAYVGIDLILTSAGPLVLEINPRLTTSYVGLSDLLKKNLAEVILLSQNIINTDPFKKYRYTSQQRLGINNVCA